MGNRDAAKGPDDLNLESSDNLIILVLTSFSTLYRLYHDG